MKPTSDFEIRPISPDDHNAWRDLWSMYCAFYDVTLAPGVTDQTWRRVVDPSVPIHGLVACGPDGAVLGFCHYVCHPNTWSDRTVCYLEDVFVAPHGRRLGIATAFIERLKAMGVQENWTRIYWVTNQENAAAQATYDRVAKRSGHIRYEIALGG
ncbi:GNAT family N-acetyltransferase [Burkholderia ubonensis]|uniref:N-acetyltransferase domain-containing protein n=1 Tax=Burkholderia ubonensis subsp. mesacidophila TaxID=265293 RepID=A0A2A4FKR8_9BURK|nr:GNAT family N-acetyltransferase [Burkholderia ubonensis]PCE33214.1 hypothetical protein BZL54_06525 [Burkholderia ubonensis subsp. mesacidophila]